jgi:hypothetical protein
VGVSALGASAVEEELLEVAAVAPVAARLAVDFDCLLSGTDDIEDPTQGGGSGGE